MKTFPKLLASLLAFFAASHAPSLFGVALDISAAGGYNLLTWGDADLINSDTEGRVAVGGNATFSSYSIGEKASGGDLSTASFVVGGDLTAGHGSVKNGSIYVGGKYSGPGYNLNSTYGSTRQEELGKDNLPFDFEQARQELTSKSLQWAQEASTGTSQLLYSTLTLRGLEEGLNIFNIDADALSLARSLEIFVPDSAKILINVSGAVVEFSNKGISGSFSPNDTLFNFFEATEVTMTGIGVQGSILAVGADVKFYSGQMNGQLIANSFSGQSWGVGEMHNYAFNNDEPEPGRANVPDSGGTLALLLASVLAIVAFRRVRSAWTRVAA